MIVVPALGEDRAIKLPRFALIAMAFWSPTTQNEVRCNADIGSEYFPTVRTVGTKKQLHDIQ